VEPLEAHPPSSEEPASIKEIKEVHVLVRNTLGQVHNNLLSSSGNWPGFVCLLGQLLKALQTALTTVLKFKELSFK